MSEYQNSLKSELNHLQSTMDAMGINASKYVLDEELTILWANAVFYNSIGYTKEEYKNEFLTVKQYYKEYAEDFNIIKKQLVKSYDKGVLHLTITCRMPIKNGKPICIRMKITFTDEKVENFPTFYSIIVDVSDLICSKGEREQYFDWMMEEFEGNIYISDMDTYELLYLNQRACTTLHSTKDKLIGKKCYNIIQERTSPCPFCTNNRLNGNEFYEWEYYNPVLERTFMIKNRMINWYGHRARIELSHDMYSEEYKLAKKDREREALIRTIPGGLCRLDARDFRTILWYGIGFLQTIGYTKKQFEEELNSECTYIQEEDLARMVSAINEMDSTGQNVVMDVSITTRKGETRVLTITLSYVSGEDSWDGIPSFYSVGIDITKGRLEQEKQRKIIEDAYQALRAANSAKTDFLSSMSHDIRTPMNAIVGMTAIAQANIDVPEKVSNCLSKINVSSRHLLSLINEVLDMSKIESGKIDLIPESVNLSELIQNVYDICRPLILEKKQDFKINIGQLQHENVIVDGDRLQQIFINILSNAIKYTSDHGKITMTINEMPSLIPNKGWYEFVFNDNGMGMPEEYIPKIFEPFSRAEDSRISKISGTGLGMAITENIVHMMNGTIYVKSKLGVGSQFTISIPLELQIDEENQNEELIGLPVLVVDDDQMVCENATDLLNELGMKGYWVSSGLEAIHRIMEAHQRQEDFFAIILDWKMPVMDGLETLKTIRKNLGDAVPIIIISAYDYSDIEAEFLEAGADAFITKPLFKSKILHVLLTFCSKYKAKRISTQIEQVDLDGKHILLVEDNELNREIAIELLNMNGLIVDSAENGAEAVQVFLNSPPEYYSAILMDIQMPVMNGYEATNFIRKMSREDAKTIPILALTANAFISDIGKAQSAGMNDHIAKPIDMEQLISVLQKWIGKDSI